MTDERDDLADMRARRKDKFRNELKRYRQEAWDKQTAQGGMAVDHGRQIPPTLNPCVAAWVNAIKDCYVDLATTICSFQDEIAELCRAGKLDPAEKTALQEHYRPFQDGIEAASVVTVCWNATGPDAHEITKEVHLIADHAKHVYAVGTRDIAALQYRLSELAGTGRLDREAHHDLQWVHCLRTWEERYHGATGVLHDQRTWDGGWDWDDNTFSDGRPVMVRARPKNWLELERRWPYKVDMCGEGPINEYPWASVCQIAPVKEPQETNWPPARYYEPVEIDLDELNQR